MKNSKYSKKGRKTIKPNEIGGKWMLSPEFRRWKGQSNLQIEALLVVGYYLSYMIYLTIFVHFENEIIHWLTLVLLPLGLLYSIQRRYLTPLSLRTTFSSIGLAKPNLKNGVIWAFLIGVLFLPVQLLMSRERDTILELLSSGKFFVLFLFAFLIMLGTAGFTEEFFFRGVLQTRLSLWLQSDFWAILLTSALFAIYHLPYAYLLKTWPSHGNLQEATLAAVGQAAPMGLVLGILYTRSKNLFAPIILHCTFNAIAGAAFINF